MKPDPKPSREVDKDYLKYIRRQPCLVYGCPNKAIAHHDPTVGAGGSDYTSVPLCTYHHIPGIHQMGRGIFQKTYSIDLNREKVRLLIGYINILKAKKEEGT